jgi:hypothetical protein
MLHPPFFARLNVLVAQWASICLGRGLARDALLYLRVGVELLGRNCFLALGTALEVLVVDAL